MNSETSVTIENGKYTFTTMPGDYRIHVLRHGQPWLILDEGSKAILALMQEVERARTAQVELSKLPPWFYQKENP